VAGAVCHKKGTRHFNNTCEKLGLEYLEYKTAVGSKAWFKQWQRKLFRDVPTPRQHMICLRLQMNLIVPVTLYQGAFSFDHFTQPAFYYRSGWVLKSNPVRARSKSLMKLIYLGGAVREWKFLLYGSLWYDTPLQACRVRKLSRSV
jgi:hypothetical protein